MSVFSGNQREVLKNILKNVLQKNTVSYNKSDNSLRIGLEIVYLPKAVSQTTLNTSNVLFR